eukprot:6211393-Pleurochrysis_carterae.AAC.1
MPWRIIAEKALSRQSRAEQHTYRILHGHQYATPLPWLCAVSAAASPRRCIASHRILVDGGFVQLTLF